MEEALADVDAVKGVRSIGIPTKIFATTHTLLHVIVSNDGLYQVSSMTVPVSKEAQPNGPENISNKKIYVPILYNATYLMMK
jgi:hypothetical protein